MKTIFGFLNVIKPPGMTSHDLVDEARKIFDIRRIGHGGTLDPGASGVLPLALGKATGLFEFLMKDSVKVYRGEIVFGISTSTLDAQGVVSGKKPCSFLTREKIEAELEKFIGEISQTPPQVSAVRHQGKHSYEWERSGIQVPLKSRTVRIDSIQMKRFSHGDFPKILVDVQSSAGMYMRALARDLGEKLGCGAYLSFLVRLESRPFRLEDAYTLEEVKEKVAQGETESVLVKGTNILPHVPKLAISQQQKVILLRWKRLPVDSPPPEGNLVQLYDGDEELIALGKIQGNRKPYFFQPLKLFP